MERFCYAAKCRTEIEAAMLFCRPHWLSLPIEMRLEILRQYRNVVENNGRPTDEYLRAVKEARDFLFLKTKERLALLIGACEERLNELGKQNQV